MKAWGILLGASKGRVAAAALVVAVAVLPTPGEPADTAAGLVLAEERSDAVADPAPAGTAAPLVAMPSTIVLGARSTITLAPGSFEPGEPVSVTVTQPAGSAPSRIEAPALADALGGIVVVFTAPDQGTGDYRVRLDASRTSYGTTVEVRGSIEVTDPVLVPGTHAPLPGSAVAALSLWFGVGAVAAVGATLVLLTIVRSRPGRLGRRGRPRRPRDP